jgi:hypothetical protein
MREVASTIANAHDALEDDFDKWVLLRLSRDYIPNFLRQYRGVVGCLATSSSS